MEARNGAAAKEEEVALCIYKSLDQGPQVCLNPHAAIRRENENRFIFGKRCFIHLPAVHYTSTFLNGKCVSLCVCVCVDE